MRSSGSELNWIEVMHMASQISMRQTYFMSSVVQVRSLHFFFLKIFVTCISVNSSLKGQGALKMDRIQNIFAGLTGREKIGFIDTTQPSLYSKARLDCLGRMIIKASADMILQLRERRLRSIRSSGSKRRPLVLNARPLTFAAL